MSIQLDHGRETLMDIFHRHRKAGEDELAARALERAMQIAEHRPEALIWKGIAALPHDPKLAFLFLVNAAQLLPDRADVQALAGRALLAQGDAKLATRYLTLAWRKIPGDLSLRMLLWQARSQSETPATLRSMILAHLPEISAPKELAQVIKLLAAQADAPAVVGVVHYLQEQREVQGWALDIRNTQALVSLKIEAGSAKVDAVANIPHPLLSAAGLPASHGGLRISVPNPTAAVHVHFADNTPLLGSPVFAMPSFSPPAHRAEGVQQHVDVLIPVFNGLDETLECINSALEARKRNSTPHRLVVIEDATPVRGLAKALKLLAGKGKITLVNNAVNLGFIRTMNRAMAMSPDKDVVWLNADTRVHGNWLDRLRNVAYSSEDIASVTPFTNNGELMSFPQSQVSHAMPSAREQAELDELAQYANINPVEIETGCGFCLYIKRTALNQVGYLDEVHLARGYGEETDWCLRARSFGWRHMGAPHVFVAHQGGVSFGAEKTLRVAQNNAILRRRYPDASSRYKAFCLRDPIKPARNALQRARLARFAQQNDVSKRSQWPKEGSNTLHVHDGTGPEHSLSLVWQRDSHRTWVTLKAPLAPLALELDYELPGDFPELVNSLSALPFKNIVFEHQLRTPAKLCDLPAVLRIPYTIVQRDGHLQGLDPTYNWQHFVTQAESVILPWRSWHCAFNEAYPQANLVVEPGLAHPAPATSKPHVLMIGDTLDNPQLIQSWVSLGRRITRERLPVTLLVKQDTPWLKTLTATGAVQVLPAVNGFSLTEIVKAAGCDAVVSLAPSPGATWLAPTLAKQFDLPLYTSPHSLGTEAGAIAVAQLPFSLSQS